MYKWSDAERQQDDVKKKKEEEREPEPVAWQAATPPTLHSGSPLIMAARRE